MRWAPPGVLWWWLLKRWILWSAPSVRSGSGYFVFAMIELRTPIGAETGDYCLESAVKDLWSSCWCNQRLRVNKGQQGPKHDSQMWTGPIIINANLEKQITKYSHDASGSNNTLLRDQTTPAKAQPSRTEGETGRDEVGKQMSISESKVAEEF